MKTGELLTELLAATARGHLVQFRGLGDGGLHVRAVHWSPGSKIDAQLLMTGQHLTSARNLEAVISGMVEKCSNDLAKAVENANRPVSGAG